MHSMKYILIAYNPLDYFEFGGHISSSVDNFYKILFLVYKHDINITIIYIF